LQGASSLLASSYKLPGSVNSGNIQEDGEAPH